ncbi:MAG: monofunctional biosynthetic peptidoglycan transglycosylase [Prevotellaceae bacterium]|jgi:monofunctional biosynthetic peptidoglycan transglycosylase|nr:monofunctional biosynthetic peptidoglycan transglycosylase [Prevotellaceae bacterium]
MNFITYRHILKRILIIAGKTILVLFLFSILLALAYRWINPPVTPLMLSRATGGASIKKTWKNIDEISPEMVAAAIASEDNNFLGHSGFDFIAIEDAINEYKEGKRKRQRGASTISQQTAKNVFLWQGRSWLRKGLEVYFTFLIENLWSKERIMEVYLNVIEMGDGIYGVEAAAQTYFHVSAKKLNRWQSALITACYPNPRMRNPSKPSAYITKRANQIVALIPKIGKTEFTAENIKAAKERYKKYKNKAAQKDKKKEKNKK